MDVVTAVPFLNSTLISSSDTTVILSASPMKSSGENESVIVSDFLSMAINSLALVFLISLSVITASTASSFSYKKSTAKQEAVNFISFFQDAIS